MHEDMSNEGPQGSEAANAKNFIPNQFPELGENFCSLGEQSYYEVMATLPKQEREKILESLRDCANDNSIFDKFLQHPAMKSSLLRGLDEKRVRILFPSILNGDAKLTPFRFRYSLKVNPEHVIDVKVEPHSTPPSNIHVLIGSNGVGKTRILSGIMDSLRNIESPISEAGSIEFVNNFLEEESDKFTNLNIIIFSAFDNFIPPTEDNEQFEGIITNYIGLKRQNSNDFKTPEEIQNELADAIEKISQSTHKIRLWNEAMELLSPDSIFSGYDLQSKNLTNSIDREEIKTVYNQKLSSGHRIVLFTITRLVEVVDEKTLVIFDEPETHLHPPLLSSFIRALSDLLIKRNGVAIIATHSPVVLQETPASCVTKIERVGEEYSLDRPRIETYAENIDTLTREVFRLQLENSGFYKIIRKRIESNPNYTFEDFMTEFESRVGSEGRVLAKSIIALRGD